MPNFSTKCPFLLLNTQIETFSYADFFTLNGDCEEKLNLLMRFRCESLRATSGRT